MKINLAYKKCSGALFFLIFILTGCSDVSRVLKVPTSAIEPTPSFTSPIVTFIFPPSPGKPAFPTYTYGKMVTSTFTTTPAAGEDFERNCIWDHYWYIYPARAKLLKFNDHCWDLSPWGIYVLDKQLNIVTENFSNDYVRALYILLPENNKGINCIDISFDVQINAFETKGDNSDLVFGIGNPNGFSQGRFLIYRVLPEDPINYVVYNERIDGYPDRIYSQFFLKQKNTYIFEIHGLELNVFRSIGDDPNQKPIRIVENDSIQNSDRVVFWIGLNLRAGSSIDASISNFRITPK